MANEIRNPELWESGARKIAWVKRNMPLLNGIEKEFEQEKPFAGLRVALSVHLEAKTAYLCKVLAAGGAEMYVTGSNPLSTQDDDLTYSRGMTPPTRNTTATSPR